MMPASRLSMLLHATSGHGARELRELQHAISTPLPLRRRIGIISLAGGTGCSTITAELACMLASRRSGTVLCVDAQGRSPTPIAGLATQLGIASLGPDAYPAAITAWWKQLAEQQRKYDLTLTDWGVTPLNRIADIAAHSHALCIVTAAERPAIQVALDVATVARASTGVVLAVNDVHHTARYATGELVRHLPVPAVLVRHDPRRTASLELPRPLSGRTGLRLLRLAAALVRYTAAPATTQEART